MTERSSEDPAWLRPARLAGRADFVPMAEISQGEGGLFLVMNRFLALAVFAVVLLGCRGPGGPMERAGRGVDNAVYDVGTGIKRTGQKIQRAAE
jgi:hypothetical protein